MSDPDPQFVEWATVLVEEVLVSAARHIHETDAPDSPIEVPVVFEVSALPAEGLLAVRSPGTRGRSIHVSIPVLPSI